MVYESAMNGRDWDWEWDWEWDWNWDWDWEGGLQGGLLAMRGVGG
jgi:hypothetical protein